MKTWIKIVTLFTLVCYLAVSSVAAVHAFPSFDDQPDSAQSVSMPAATSEMMQVNCHESAAQSSGKTSVSLCKMFCSSMCTAVPNEFVLLLESVEPAKQIMHKKIERLTRQLTVEQHPPK